ncbi:MAG: MaoC family dehydratase [Rhodospirillaceae bacterium]|jgi:acyl dehydratase|nr:MaoC family dehydratase [Rhodospirillaceae bacterium]MBT5665046.1 MaoC family dehydratase [Rhodospirillaceae bacterium]
MHTLYFDDFSLGQTFTTRSATLTEGEVVDFALKYDPQPMHLDKHASSQGMFGGLIASGIQSLALSLRLFIDLGLTMKSNIVGPGIDELRWLAPVRPGDTIHSIVEVVETRISKSKPDRGSIRLSFSTRNQDGDVVMTYTSSMILRRQPVGDTGNG